MGERYIGVENELISFKNGKQVGFNPYFETFKKTFKKNYLFSNNSIRTETGHGFYVDGNELEILTPPIALNKGFSSRLTDSLIIGRDKVLKETPDLEHTGYSMHWNLTYNGESNRNALYEAIAVPFHMFGLTPLSTGFNLRDKNNRYEILGDSLTKENQINATALLLGASLYAMEESKQTPLQLPNFDFYTGTRSNLFIPNGRYDSVNVSAPTANFQNKMQVQQYLELFYQWISPSVGKLGTKKEVQNLESFIFHKENLEFDDFKYFASIKGNNGIKHGIYDPINITNSQKSRQILKKSETERELPIECKLLGAVVDKFNQIKTFEWENLCYNDNGGQEIQGIGNIYRHLSFIFNDLPKFSASLNPQGKDLEEITNIVLKDKIKYEHKEDFSTGKDNSLASELKLGIKNSKPLKYLRNVGVASLIALGVSFVGMGIYHNVMADNHADNLISSLEVTEKNE